MEHNPEENLRSQLQHNYAILEHFSMELERASLNEERAEEILAQVKNIVVCSMHWLHELITTNTDPVQVECLEGSVIYLQYALSESKAAPTSRHKTLKKVLYHSKMALLGFWGWLPVISV